MMDWRLATTRQTGVSSGTIVDLTYFGINGPECFAWELWRRATTLLFLEVFSLLIYVRLRIHV